MLSTKWPRVGFVGKRGENCGWLTMKPLRGVSCDDLQPNLSSVATYLQWLEVSRPIVYVLVDSFCIDNTHRKTVLKFAWNTDQCLTSQFIVTWVTVQLECGSKEPAEISVLREKTRTSLIFTRTKMLFIVSMLSLSSLQQAVQLSKRNTASFGNGLLGIFVTNYSNLLKSLPQSTTQKYSWRVGLCTVINIHLFIT